MADAWENLTFGDMSHDGTADSDGDGFSDFEEYEANTDPNNNLDFPPTEDDDTDDDTGGLSTTNLMLIFIIVALLIIIAVIVAIVMMRRRRKEEEEKAEDGETLEAEVEGADVFEDKKLAKAIGGKAKPMTIDQDGPEAEAATPEADVVAPDGMEAPDMPEEMPGMDEPDLVAEPEAVGAIDGPEAPGSKPLLALPPAKIFEAEFDEGPRIDELFVMTQEGLLLHHFSYRDTSVVDEDILASMLTVVQNFVSDSFNKKKASLKKLEFGEFNILITPGEHISVVAISPDKNISDLEKPIKLMVQEIEDNNTESLEDWDGDQDSILGLDASVEKLVHGGYE